PEEVALASVDADVGTVARELIPGVDDGRTGGTSGAREREDLRQRTLGRLAARRGVVVRGSGRRTDHVLLHVDHEQRRSGAEADPAAETRTLYERPIVVVEQLGPGRLGQLDHRHGR